MFQPLNSCYTLNLAMNLNNYSQKLNEVKKSISVKINGLKLVNFLMVTDLFLQIKNIRPTYPKF